MVLLSLEEVSGHNSTFTFSRVDGNYIIDFWNAMQTIYISSLQMALT